MRVWCTVWSSPRRKAWAPNWACMWSPVITFSIFIPRGHDPFGQHCKLWPVGKSKTGSRWFLDFLSNLTNLIGWEYGKTKTLHVLRKSGPARRGRDSWCWAEGARPLGTRIHKQWKRVLYARNIIFRSTFNPGFVLTGFWTTRAWRFFYENLVKSQENICFPVAVCGSKRGRLDSNWISWFIVVFSRRKRQRCLTIMVAIIVLTRHLSNWQRKTSMLWRKPRKGGINSL